AWRSTSRFSICDEPTAKGHRVDLPAEVECSPGAAGAGAGGPLRGPVRLVALLGDRRLHRAALADRLAADQPGGDREDAAPAAHRHGSDPASGHKAAVF